jgi:O-antigen/teichoic acid export membrane protein
MGLGTVATTEMSMCVARQDYEQAKRIFRGSFFCITTVGLLVCALFSALAWALPWHDWLNVRQVGRFELSAAMTLLAWYVFFAIFLTLLLGAYRTIGRYAHGQVISNSFRLLEFVALLAAVILGGGVVAAAAAFLAVRVFYAGFVWFDIRRRAGWLRLEKFSFEWPTVRALLPASLSMMTVYLGQNFMTQGLVTMLGISLGAASVVVFSTVRTLCNFAKQVIGIVNLSVFSEYSISLGKQDFAALRRLHARAVQAIVGLTLVSVVGLKVFGPFVLDLWTKGRVAAEEPFFSLYLAYIFINSLWLGSWTMLLGCNRHRDITRFYLLTSLGVLVLVYFGIHTFGLSAVPLALMMSDGAFSWAVLRKSLDVLQQPAPDFLRQAFTLPKIKPVWK